MRRAPIAGARERRRRLTRASRSVLALARRADRARVRAKVCSRFRDAGVERLEGIFSSNARARAAALGGDGARVSVSFNVWLGCDDGGIECVRPLFRGA